MTLAILFGAAACTTTDSATEDGAAESDTSGGDDGATSMAVNTMPATTVPSGDSGTEPTSTTTPGADTADTASDDLPGTTTDDGDETDTPEPESVTLRNTDERCEQGEVISPILPDEAGHFAATTLTPETYPFEVTSIAYDVPGTSAPAACNSTLAHRVEIYVIDGVEPPADPVDEAVAMLSIDVEADGAAVVERTVEIELDEAFVLTEGQSLIVAVEMAGDAELLESVCLLGCRDTNGIAAVDWWSNADSMPYAWADMVADFGFASNFTTRATGAAQ